jgi:hypothetical protein
MGILRLFCSLVLTVLLSGCGLNRMTTQYEEINFKVTPQIIETHSGKINFSLDVDIPEKYFAKNATIDFTPVLVFEGGEKNFKTITIQGEEATGGEATIFKDKGGSFSYQDEIEYSSEMINSNVIIRAVGKIKDKVKALGSNTIAKGVIATSTRVQDNEQVANNNHGYEHETILTETSTIYFLVNQSNIRTTEKSKSEIQKLKEFAKKGYKTHSIEIKSYASPEGKINTNDNISNNRMNSTVNYTKRLLRSLKVDGARNSELYTESSIGEDWKGFESLIKASNIKDKNRINKIIRATNDVELREQQIRDLSELYQAIENDVLPQLRKATIIIKSFEPKKTDEEIATLSITNPNALDVKELLFSATLADNAVTKKEIYNKVVELHNDWRGYNNIACMYLADGNLDEALNFLEKSEALSKNQSDILNNQGIIASRNGELAKAQKLFDRGNASDFNQATLDIRQGEYEKAARFFKNKKSHNAALAQLMINKNVSCEEDTPECHYLNAISNARKGENTKALSNLENAIKHSPSYKQEAILDLEFINLRSDENFLNLTK